LRDANASKLINYSANLYVVATMIIHRLLIFIGSKFSRIFIFYFWGE